MIGIPKKKEIPFDKSAYDQQYQKSNVKILKVPLNIKTDADILEHLETKENKSGYVKRLIRSDIQSDQDRDE